MKIPRHSRGTVCGCLTVLAAFSLSVVLLPAIALAGRSADAQPKPNVILVITDDQGYGDLRCHGNTMINTPHLDRLHGQSVRLTDFHVSPCCTPTRAALMTGHDTLRTGAWGTTWGRSLPRKDEPMMAEPFAAAGYRTGVFGKWHLGDNYPFRPQDRGFQEVLVHGGGGVGQTPDYWGNTYFDDTYFHNGKPEKFTGYCTDVWFNGALEFIRANKSQPFFVYLTTNAPHGPLNVDPKYSQPYQEKGVPPNMAKFYGMIENIDENMGRLLGKLDEWKLRQQTILIFMTDNGTANGVVPPGRKSKKPKPTSPAQWTGFNAGMRGKKGSLYDGGHRVPCFIRWPGGELTGGRDVTRLTAHVDLFPTLLSLCGIDPPRGVKFDGKSLVPLLRDGRPTIRNPQSSSIRNPQSAIRNQAGWPDRTLFAQYRQSPDPPTKWNAAVMTQRWRLIGGKQLYDIQADPGQTRNVADQHPEIVEKLRGDYETYSADVSRRFDEYCEIILGSDAENPAHLTAFDWHTSTPWNQGHIRRGTPANGFWAVEVAQAGKYEITLRRWPRELNLPITAACDGGKVIRATSARLKIGPVDVTRPIPDGAAKVSLTTQLPARKTRLQTWLTDKPSGQSRGAYYVSVKRLPD